MEVYYDRRAAEYDDWWYGTGLFADRDRPGWDEEVEGLIATLARLPAARTLDVACGTGFLTRHLPGEVVAFDQSSNMLEAASRRLAGIEVVQGLALDLPFADPSFDRVFTAHFYGHLRPGDRRRFLDEARRVSSEFLVVDSALRPAVRPEEVQERILNDGSRWMVLKRYFTGAGLAAELGGGRVLHDGRWFVAVVA